MLSHENTGLLTKATGACFLAIYRLCRYCLHLDSLRMYDVTAWHHRCWGISNRSEELTVSSRTCTVLVAAIGATEYFLLGVMVSVTFCRWRGVCDLHKSTPGE